MMTVDGALFIVGWLVGKEARLISQTIYATGLCIMNFKIAPF